VLSDAQTQGAAFKKQLAEISPTAAIIEAAFSEVLEKILSLTEQLEQQSNNPQLFLNPDDYMDQGQALFSRRALSGGDRQLRSA